MKKWDVIVVGAGNAALCAALSAAEHGASVLVIEKAPYASRGGNTYFTDAALRSPYQVSNIKELADGIPSDVVVKPYSEDDFMRDFIAATRGETDPTLLQVLVSNALSTIKWLHEKGLKFEPAVKFGSLQGDKTILSGVPVQVAGEGKVLYKWLFDACIEHGISIFYRTEFLSLLQEPNGKVIGAIVQTPSGKRQLFGHSVILACGGFESSKHMRARYLGSDWEMVKVRGTDCNTGSGLMAALKAGAKRMGQWDGCHAIHWDANAPTFGDRELTILLSRRKHHLGIVVNRLGKRFLDEGEDFPLMTYAKVGQNLLQQPGHVAFQVFDAKAYDTLPDEYRSGSWVRADTLEELSLELGIHPPTFLSAVGQYNDSVRAGVIDASVLDGKSTYGLEPPKSNWATKIVKPPFYGFPIVCGVTFTFGGIAINERAQVLDKYNVPIPGLYACGEMVGLFHHNYPGGAGLVAGAVFGKIAGESAVRT